ncbi:MAG: hypothetical protein OXC82_10990 [Rhodobacteraceae bacterium]|nr:hypothetical protein [Paracoccaceae bacterium]MCY4250940.1 hypothetical protein [Paracoccaceae bacterium]
MTRGVPMIDPEKDLKGATPELLAKALLRNSLLPKRVVKPVAGDKVPVKKVATDHAVDRVTHLVKGS